jgi:hypothetical protein
VQRVPLLGGRLRGGTRRSIGPISSPCRGDESWPTGQGLLRGALDCPFSRGDRRRAWKNHFRHGPVPLWLTACGGATAFPAARQGDDHNIRHCWRKDFCRQGGPPPGRNRHCRPGRRGSRLGAAGQGEPRDSPTCRGVGSTTIGRGCYTGLSEERGGNMPLRCGIALHIAGQLSSYGNSIV